MLTFGSALKTMGVRRKRISKKKKRQKGGAMFRRKPRLVDKIAELMGQAAKGISDNVKYYRKRRRR